MPRSMPPRRLLVVSYYYPPFPSVGSNRWAAMVPALRELGHEVTVLTTNAGGTLPDDGDGVVRTGDLQGSPTLRKLLRRPPEGQVGGPAAPAGETIVVPPTILNQGIVPDTFAVTWLPGALRVARRLVRERTYDCVITSAPPDSTALLPLGLGRRRPAWIADFRDGWRFEPLRGDWPLRAQDRIDERLERRVARSAEVVVGVTRPIVEDFARRLGARAEFVPNAWDPSLEAEVEAAEPVELDPDRINLVHTGQLSTQAGRDIGPLLQALRDLAARRPEARRLRLVLVGNLDVGTERRLAEFDLGDMVQACGPQPRLRAIATQRAGDAVVLVTSPRHASHATGKLFEYLVSGRPILALAAGNEAARIVRETGSGTTVPPDDVDAIAAALEQVLDGRLTRDAADATELARYVHPAPARAVGDLVEEAIALRASASASG